MAKEKCIRCEGTGWASAARDAGLMDAHWSQQPFGIYECPRCWGSGVFGYDDSELEKAKKEFNDSNQQ